MIWSLIAIAAPSVTAFSASAGIPRLAPEIFGTRHVNHLPVYTRAGLSPTSLGMVESPPSEGALIKIPDDDETPIAFMDVSEASFIDCYADSVATLDGVTYTIGSPCDCPVALTYFQGDELIPVELDSELMNSVFPVAESIVEEEFGDELGLQRTPQTLTLVGELEDEDEQGESEVEDNDAMDDEEEVEILLSFEHDGLEIHLVKLLDPVLLVGKEDPESPDRRILLTSGESNHVMPAIEEIFLRNQVEETI